MEKNNNNLNDFFESLNKLFKPSFSIYHNNNGPILETTTTFELSP